MKDFQVDRASPSIVDPLPQILRRDSNDSLGISASD